MVMVTSYLAKNVGRLSPPPPSILTPMKTTCSIPSLPPAQRRVAYNGTYKRVSKTYTLYVRKYRRLRTFSGPLYSRLVTCSGSKVALLLS